MSLDWHLIMVPVSQLDAFCMSQRHFNGHKAFQHQTEARKTVYI